MAYSMVIFMYSQQVTIFFILIFLMKSKSLLKIQQKPEYKKITLNIPTALLEAALSSGGQNITQTVKTGLQLIAAKNSYAALKRYKGKVKFNITLDELRRDR
jgi:hypothetical protein